jgi:hypothetical protein
LAIECRHETGGHQSDDPRTDGFEIVNHRTGKVPWRQPTVALIGPIRKDFPRHPQTRRHRHLDSKRAGQGNQDDLGVKSLERRNDFPGGPLIPRCQVV